MAFPTVFRYTFLGDEMEVTARKAHYEDNGGVAIYLCDTEGDVGGSLTVNLTNLPSGKVTIDTNTNSQGLVGAFVEAGCIWFTGGTITSGFCQYPIAEVDPEWLASLEEI